MNHLGQQTEWRGPNGERYAVYVMTPSGLVTIDPGVVFSGGGTAEGAYRVTIWVYCTVAAVWTFGLPSGVTATIASGGSATGVEFTLTSGTINKPIARTVTFTATGTASGVSQTISITLRALDNI